MLKHQHQTINAITAMRGTAEGRLRVELKSTGGHDYILRAQDAIRMVFDNPRIEFQAKEFRKLD